MIWLRRVGFGLALAFFVLTFLNASWILPARPGHVHLIANGGIAQDYQPGARQSACPASAILPPLHHIFEDTVRSVYTAHAMGADLVAIDLVRTADGALVLYPDRDLDCRSDGKGPVSARTLADLRRLDIGYGYTADHGATYPLRGAGRGQIATLDDVLDADPRASFAYRFPGNDPAALDIAIRVLRARHHDPVALGEGFIADAGLAATAQRAFPGVWAMAGERSAACLGSYRLFGWTGLMPGSCDGATLEVPLDATMTLWGWPARFELRLAAAHGGAIVVADSAGNGLRHSRQLGTIPVTYRGMALVDNYWTVGPALRPSRDGRTNAEAVAAQARDDSDQ